MATFRARHQPTQEELGGLFAPIEKPPVRPAPGPAERRTLPIDGTLQARYEAWRQTDEGRVVYDEIRGRALAAARAGERRIGVKGITEEVRRALRTSINNTLVALIARELRDREPVLRPLIELRERTAA